MKFWFLKQLNLKKNWNDVQFESVTTYIIILAFKFFGFTKLGLLISMSPMVPFCFCQNWEPISGQKLNKITQKHNCDAQGRWPHMVPSTPLQTLLLHSLLLLPEMFKQTFISCTEAHLQLPICIIQHAHIYVEKREPL